MSNHIFDRLSFFKIMQIEEQDDTSDDKAEEQMSNNNDPEFEKQTGKKEDTKFK